MERFASSLRLASCAEVRRIGLSSPFFIFFICCTISVFFFCEQPSPVSVFWDKLCTIVPKFKCLCVWLLDTSHGWTNKILEIHDPMIGGGPWPKTWTAWFLLLLHLAAKLAQCALEVTDWWWSQLNHILFQKSSDVILRPAVPGYCHNKSQTKL